MFWSSWKRRIVAFLVQDLCVVNWRKDGGRGERDREERGYPKTLKSIGGEGLERANREF
jgi:hypothetical protein